MNPGENNFSRPLADFENSATLLPAPKDRLGYFQSSLRRLLKQSHGLDKSETCFDPAHYSHAGNRMPAVRASTGSGAPGLDAHWPSAAKNGFGTSTTLASKVWLHSTWCVD